MQATKVVDHTVSKLRAAISAELSDSDIKEINRIVSEMTVEIINETTRHCCDRVSTMCGPRTDIAHQIAEDISRERVALVANLQSMR